MPAGRRPATGASPRPRRPLRAPPSDHGAHRSRRLVAAGTDGRQRNTASAPRSEADQAHCRAQNPWPVWQPQWPPPGRTQNVPCPNCRRQSTSSPQMPHGVLMIRPQRVAPSAIAVRQEQVPPEHLKSVSMQVSAPAGQVPAGGTHCPSAQTCPSGQQILPQRARPGRHWQRPRLQRRPSQQSRSRSHLAPTLPQRAATGANPRLASETTAGALPRIRPNTRRREAVSTKSERASRSKRRSSIAAPPVDQNAGIDCDRKPRMICRGVPILAGRSVWRDQAGDSATVKSGTGGSLTTAVLRRRDRRSSVRPRADCASASAGPPPGSSASRGLFLVATIVLSPRGCPLGDFAIAGMV